MIRIRSATSGDLSALVPLYRDFFTLHRRLLGNPEPLTMDRCSGEHRGDDVR